MPDSPIVTLDARTYHDGGTYERERRAVFGREWQLVGYRTALRDTGDFVQSTFAGWSIVVVVHTDGTLRAFHNVCRHRAGPLVVDDAGRCQSFVCRYHGWSYDLDGGLRSAREFGDSDFDPSAFGLWPVAVDEWCGLVFVNLDADAVALDDDLGAFFAACDGLPLERFTFGEHVEHEVAANWKTYADNYMEGYHIPLVHPGLQREVDAKRYRVDVGDHFCIHSVPTRDGAVNAGRWLWRYPNLALNVYPEGMNIERIVPTGPRSTRVVYDYFFLDPDATEANRAIVTMGNQVLAEDQIICEQVQRNLEAGMYETGRLSPRHENGVAAFQRWVRDSLERQGFRREVV
jgi:choline monooxygenase